MLTWPVFSRTGKRTELSQGRGFICTLPVGVPPPHLPNALNILSQVGALFSTRTCFSSYMPPPPLLLLNFWLDPRRRKVRQERKGLTRAVTSLAEEATGRHKEVSELIEAMTPPSGAGGSSAGGR